MVLSEIYGIVGKGWAEVGEGLAQVDKESSRKGKFRIRFVFSAREEI